MLLLKLPPPPSPCPRIYHPGAEEERLQRCLGKAETCFQFASCLSLLFGQRFKKLDFLSLQSKHTEPGSTNYFWLISGGMQQLRLRASGPSARP